MNLRRMNSVATRQLAHRLQLLHGRQGHLGLERDAMQLPLSNHSVSHVNKEPILPCFLVQFPGSIVGIADDFGRKKDDARIANTALISEPGCAYFQVAKRRAVGVMGVVDG